MVPYICAILLKLQYMRRDVFGVILYQALLKDTLVSDMTRTLGRQCIR
jgi:hypothetical protein